MTSSLHRRHLYVLGFDCAREGIRAFDLARAIGPCSWPGFGKGEDWRWVVVGAVLFIMVTFAVSIFLQVIVQQVP